MAGATATLTTLANILKELYLKMEGYSEKVP